MSIQKHSSASLPLTQQDVFSFWDLDESWVVELRPEYSFHRLTQHKATLVSEAKQHLVMGELLTDIVAQVRQPTTLSTIVERNASQPRAAVYKAIFDLYRANFLHIWEKNPDNDISYELSISSSAAVFRTKIFIQDLHPSADPFIVESITASIKKVGFLLSHDARSADLCLCVTDSYFSPELYQEIEKLAAYSTTAPIKLSGQALWLGPTFSNSDSQRLYAFRQRLLVNFPIEAEILRATGEAPSPIPPSTWSLEFGALLAGRLLAEHFPRKDRESIQENCITFSYKHLEKRLHSISRLIRPSEIAIENDGAVVSRDGGKRLVEPSVFLEQVKCLVSPITGLIPDLIELKLADGFHVCQTIQTEPAPLIHKENRRIGTRFGAAGKGETAEQARASCIGEVIERYSACFQGTEQQHYMSLNKAREEGLLALDPRALLLFSEAQYRARSRWSHTSFHFVPEPFNPDEKISWVSARLWRDHQKVFLPTAYAYFNYNDFHPSSTQICFADSNGCAVGMNFEEAFMQALYELIERDACAIWWYNRVKLPAYDLDTSESQFIRTATSRYADLGRNLIVLDLRNDLDIPIACAISWTDSGSEIGVGLGCDLDMEIAVSRAICELNQFVAGISIGPEVSSQSIQSEIVEWITNTKIREVDFMVPLDDGKVAIQRREECKNSSLNQDLERVINRLAERGLDTYYLDMSRPEAGLRCVRAIVPGLRHFWARFAPGRLYDVPVKLGWLTKPTPEQGLNPIPFFL